MLLTSTAMRELEARAFAAGASPDGLMEAAGLGLARVARQFFPWPGLCLAVFGKGNNGGDALVAVRHLAEAGWDVKLVPAFPAAEWSAVVRAKYEALGQPACAGPEIFERAPVLAEGRPILVLDGLLGTGASGSLRGPVAEMTRRINALRARSHAHVLALDLPTGLDGDTGAIAEDCVIADTTATIACAKVGLLADAATTFVGRLAPVPLPDLPTDETAAAATVATPELLHTALPRRGFDTHKGDYGRVGIVAGAPGTLGAAVLCASACVRAGAGLVTLYAAPEAAARLAAACPPEVMVHTLASPREVLSKKHDVLAIGPGLGSAHAAEIVDVIAFATQPTVVDADGLNALAQRLDVLRDVPAERVLTPHPGEMERLAPGRLGPGRAHAAREFADRFPLATLLLKGARTIVAKAGEPVSYNTTGSPGLATGGMGDSLTGVIAALLAQHVPAFPAARLGAWLCGRAGEIAISHGGETEETLTPTRLTDFLARAFRDLRAGCF